MTTPYLTEILVTGHGADLRRQAGTARLAALARCCSPRTWRRLTRRATRAVLQLGNALRPVRSTAACCVGA